MVDEAQRRHLIEAGFEVLSGITGTRELRHFGKVSKSEQIGPPYAMHHYAKIQRGVRDDESSHIFRNLSSIRTY